MTDSTFLVYLWDPLRPREGEELAWVQTASKGRAGARTQVCWLPTLFPLGPATALPYIGATVKMKEALEGLWLWLGSGEKWTLWEAHTQWLQPPSLRLLGLWLGLHPKDHDARKDYGDSCLFLFFSSQWASVDIKYMMIFKEANRNPPRKMQTPWICCAPKKMQWVYDLLRHTRDSFFLTDGNLRLFCFLPLCVTRPDCVKLLASKPGCE